MRFPGCLLFEFAENWFLKFEGAMPADEDDRFVQRIGTVQPANAPTPASRRNLAKGSFRAKTKNPNGVDDVIC